MNKLTMKNLDRPSTPSLSTSNADASEETESIRVPRIAVMWSLIALVLTVVGAYLASAPQPVRHDLQILPVPAPMGPTPADSELIASAR